MFNQWSPEHTGYSSFIFGYKVFSSQFHKFFDWQFTVTVFIDHSKWNGRIFRGQTQTLEK